MPIHLDSTDVLYLRSLLAEARQAWPSEWQAWYLRGIQEPLGLMCLERAQYLSSAMPQHMPLVQVAQGWVWHADNFTAGERSQVLQGISQALKGKGQITGWRNETYACWGWIDSAWPYTRPELFRLERAAFRYFGLRSHAAHVHGLMPDARMWCGRRALHKSTDPGLLDNLAAGGLPAGEQPMQCAVREVFEEAGLEQCMNDFLPQTSEVLTERKVAEGWHSERLFVYNLQMTQDQRPNNLDGEVSEFLCLSLTEVIQRMKANEFTPDAAFAIAKTFLQD